MTTSRPTNPNPEIKAWGVYYVASRNAKIFCGAKDELEYAFHSQLDAIKCCQSANIGERLDELHIGYRVRPLYEIPAGVIVS